jgi:hypothetical protein
VLIPATQDDAIPVDPSDVDETHHRGVVRTYDTNDGGNTTGEITVKPSATFHLKIDPINEFDSRRRTQRLGRLSIDHGRWERSRVIHGFQISTLSVAARILSPSERVRGY